jgi:dTDP-4-amino-4,6-dideoxygalactose transaminase
LIAHLQACGFDATRGASSMTVVAPAQSQSELRASKAESVFAQLCYLPAHEGMSSRDIERLAAAVQSFATGAVAGGRRAA